MSRKLHHPTRPLLEVLEDRLAPSASVLTYHDSSARTGQQPNETILTQANVNAADFGKRFTTPVDGMVFAQPLFVPGVHVTVGSSRGVHDVVFVATEHDSLYAIDAGSGRVLWKDRFLKGLPGATVTPVPSSVTGSSGVGPESGITGTPVIDAATQTLYVVTTTREVVRGNQHIVQRLHAVGLSDGREKPGSPAAVADTSFNNGVFTYNSGPTVRGTGDGSIQGRITYNALRQLQRAALTLAGGSVYLATAGQDGDIPPYHGWVVGFDAATLKLKAAFNTTPNGSDGGIWEAGGGLAVDSQGFLYASTGNGTFDATLNSQGMPNRGDYGDTVLKLAVDPSSSPTHQNANGWGLKVVDYFTPHNEATLDAQDLDLGSTAPVVLPDALGSARHPHLLIASSKTGTIYLIDRDHMGHFATTDHVVQELNGALGSAFDTPAYFHNRIYYGAPGQTVKAFTILNGSARLFVTPSSRTPDTFDYPGTTPTISSNGTSNPILWGLDRGSGELRAYRADKLGVELYTSSQATGGRDTLGSVVTFTVPTVAGGRVFVGTANALVGYGLLPRRPVAALFDSDGQ